jgi:hypothetical protein
MTLPLTPHPSRRPQGAARGSLTLIHQPLPLISPYRRCRRLRPWWRRTSGAKRCCRLTGRLGRSQGDSWWRTGAGSGGGAPLVLAQAAAVAAGRGSLAPTEICRCCGFWPYGDAVGGLCGADLRNSVELHTTTSRGGAAAGEN